jgi:serine/threonine-protein kinase
MLTAVVVGALIALWQANLARVEARKANAIRDFLVGVFERNSVAHADGAAARKTTAEELLAQSAREIRGRLHEAPEVRRELLGVMARLYSSLDLQAPAIELLNDQLELERRTEGPDSVAVARTLAHLAFSQVQTGNYELAEETSRQSLAIFRARGDQRSLEHALAYGNLAQAAYRLARSPDVVRSNYQAGLSLIEKHHPRNHWRMEMMLGLVRADLLAQDYPAAVTHSERALALLDANAVDANGIVRGSVLETLAHSLSWVNRTAEAERLLLEAITEFDRAGGPDHPFAAEARRELGAQYMWAGRRAEARELLGKALPAMEKNKGPDDVELTSHARTTYASTLYLRGELAAAEPHMRQAWRATRGVATLLAPHTDINLLRLSTQRGRFAEAREFARGLEETLIKSFGNGSWMHQTGVARLGEFALAEGRAAEARRLFTRLRDDFPEAPDALTNARAAARAGLVRLALAEGDVTGARTQAAELLADIERARGRGDMPDEEAEARLLLGVALARGGDSAAARAHLERALARREAMDAPESLWLAEIRLQLAQVLVRLGDRAAARREFTLAEEAHRRQGEVGPQYATLLEEVRRALIR